MEKELKMERFTRFLMILGGAIVLLFGLLTALIPYLAYALVVDPHQDLLVPDGSWVRPYVYYLPFDFLPLLVQWVTHPLFVRLTLGLSVASVGGFLSLVSTVRHGDKLASLGFVGSFLGVFGFLLAIPSFQPPFVICDMFILGTWQAFVPWFGFCLTLVGVSLMLISSAVRYRGLQRITLLGVPLLLASWLIYPLLIATTNNIPLLISICRSTSASAVIGALAISGYALTLSGSAFGVWKSRALLSAKSVVDFSRERDAIIVIPPLSRTWPRRRCEEVNVKYVVSLLHSLLSGQA